MGHAIIRLSPRTRAQGRRFGFWIGAGVALFAADAAAQSARPPRDDLAAFPAARQGQVRRVIRLPPARDETALRVGVIVGRTMWADCNRQVLSTTLEERVAQGWGYNYYVVTRAAPSASTRMACPPNSRNRQFIRSSDEPLLRYNSRVPLVIFAPTDIEIRYRIWRAGAETTAG